MRIHKRFLISAILPLFLLAMPELCFAVNDGSAQLATFIKIRIIDNALYALSGVAGAAMFYYGIRMIVDAYNDKAYTDVINSFIYVLTGFIVIGLSHAFQIAFIGTGVLPASGIPFNPSNLSPGIGSIASFMAKGAEGAFTLIVVIAGLRMITAQGDEGTFDKWRKVLIGNCIGVMLILIADSIRIAIQTPNDPGAIVAELGGIGLFMLTIIGFASVLALIIAGILLIISVDEAQRDRAKRAVIGTLLSLLVVIASYTLIVTFVS